MMARGYAATYDGRILVDTVSPHERAAMVNWLVAHAGFLVPNGMVEQLIREAFKELSSDLPVAIQPVTIQIAESA